MVSRVTLAALLLATTNGCLLLYSAEDESGGAGAGAAGGAGGSSPGTGGLGGAHEGGGGSGGSAPEVYSLGALGRDVVVRGVHGAALSGATTPEQLHSFQGVSDAALLAGDLGGEGAGLTLLDDGAVLLPRAARAGAPSPVLRCGAEGCGDWGAGVLPDVTYSALAAIPNGVAALRADGGTVDLLDLGGAPSGSLGDPDLIGTRIVARSCPDGSDRLVWATEDSAGLSTVHRALRSAASVPFELDGEVTFDAPVAHLALAPDCTLFGAVERGETSDYFELKAAEARPSLLPVQGPSAGRVAASDSHAFVVERGVEPATVRLLVCPREAAVRADCQVSPPACGTIGGVARRDDGQVVLTCDAALLGLWP